MRIPLHALSWVFLLSESPQTPYNFVGTTTLDARVDRARLDAALRGACEAYPHFTWRLRITAVVAFAAIWVAMASLRGQL